MSLKSFIPQLQAVRNLIDLTLSSELENVPTLVFASSISDLQSELSYFGAVRLLTATRFLHRRTGPSNREPGSEYCDRHGLRRV